MTTRRRAQDLTPAELEARRARDRARKAAQRGTAARDTTGDNAVDDAGQRGTNAGHDARDTRDKRGTDARDTSRDTSRDNAGQTRDNSAGQLGRGTTTEGKSSSRGVLPSAVAGHDSSAGHAGHAGQNGSRDTTTLAPRTPDAPAPRWEPRGDDDTDLIHARTARNVARARDRDWAAIDRCGLCDHNGYVVVVPADETGIPTVAFCAHGEVHTLNAARERQDLQ